MECNACNNTITPGMEIMVDELSRDRAHCPYCLQILGSEPMSFDREKDKVWGKRDEMRRKIRDRFVNRLLEASPDGRLRCPVCEHSLNESDELLLRNSEYFKCHLCGHDLATVAYRQEAYHPQRWLPVVFAIRNHWTEKKCEGCCYAGAIATACQKAFSWMPRSESEPRGQIARMLRWPHEKIPNCDWESCVAVKQYRKLAGNGLLLL